MKRFVPHVFGALSVLSIASSVHAASGALPADPLTDIPARNPGSSDNPAKPAVAQPDPAPADAPLVAALEPAPDTRQVECMAKVILHEAGNQSRRGQMAVAQVIRTRMKKFGLANDVCRVVKQPGQFFNVDRFNPARATARWTQAVAVATATLKGGDEEVVPGALFFHAAGHPMRGRARVAQIGQQVFYR